MQRSGLSATRSFGRTAANGRYAKTGRCCDGNMPAAVDARALANVRSLFHLIERDRRRSVQVIAEENLGPPITYKLFTKSVQS